MFNDENEYMGGHNDRSTNSLYRHGKQIEMVEKIRPKLDKGYEHQPMFDDFQPHEVYVTDKGDYKFFYQSPEDLGEGRPLTDKELEELWEKEQKPRKHIIVERRPKAPKGYESTD